MEKKPSLKLSIFGIGGVLAILLLGVLVIKVDIVILMITAIIYLTLISKFNNIGVSDIIEGMAEGCKQAFVGLLFFLLIGGLIASWIEAGIVPSMVYYGLKIINPQYFLITSFVLCSLVSLVLGTSWGTIGTMGVAILGIAASSNVPIPTAIIAGSIVSGAWFGDKISPVSDSTVLTATLTETNIFSHIKSMSMTTIPSYFITLIMYLIINNHYTSVKQLNVEQINIIQSYLSTHFTINWMIIVPVLILAIMCILKVDAVVSLLVAIITGIFCSVIVQNMSIKESLNVIMNGMVIDSGINAVDSLLNRGGINSMMPTFLLGFMAICLGGVIQKVQYLTVIVERVTKKLNTTVKLVFMTMLTCTISNMAFADNYLTMVLNSNMYKKIYKEKGLDSSMLSRAIEESSTMSAPLIPWTAASSFVVGVLGVSVMEYGKYAFLNIVNPIFSLIVTALGIFVIKGYNKK